MKYQRLVVRRPAALDLDLGVFVFDDNPRATTPVRALAGPFLTGDHEAERDAALWFIVERTEATLKPEQRALWAEVLETAGGAKADPAQLMGLLEMIQGGRSAPFVRKAARPVKQILAWERADSQREFMQRLAWTERRDFKERAVGRDP